MSKDEMKAKEERNRYMYVCRTCHLYDIWEKRKRRLYSDSHYKTYNNLFPFSCYFLSSTMNVAVFYIVAKNNCNRMNRSVHRKRNSLSMASHIYSIISPTLLVRHLKKEE
jgi:hypothetical protein